MIQIWPGLGKLEGKEIRISEKGLTLVKNHLKHFDIDGVIFENHMMVERLKVALKENRPLTGADASFYIHEITEATKTKRLSEERDIPYSHVATDYDFYQEVHWGAINKYQVSPFSVYHPEVINQVNQQALEAGEEFVPYDERWIKFWENFI